MKLSRIPKRLTALLCTSALLLTTVPFTASAEDTRPSATVTASKADGTQTAADSIEESALLPTSATKALDTLPQNVRSLMDSVKNTDRVVPCDNPYELTVQHADGSYTTEVYASPVKYTDEKGQTQYVDTTVRSASLWDQLFSSSAYRHQSGYVDVDYAAKITDGITVDDAFTMAVPTADDRQKAEAGTDENGNGKVVYADAFGKDTYAEYINTAGGFKENIVLEKNIGQNTFDFAWHSDTHIPVLINNDTAIQIVKKDDPQQVDYTMSSLYVYDSYDPTAAKKPSTHKHWTDNCSYAIMDQGKGDYIIRAIVPKDYLDHPETVYPVTIDPSVSASTATSNVEDAYVSQTASSTNYGSETRLRFGYNGGKMYSYVRFKTLPSIPAGAYFTSVTLKVSYLTGQTTPPAMNLVAKACKSDFSESTIRWDNKPDVDTVLPAVAPVITNGCLSSCTFNLTVAARNWFANILTNHGVRFTYQNETYNDYNSVASSEMGDSRVPKLTINYTVLNSPTAGITNDAYYYIRNYSTGKYLTVPSESYNVNQSTYTGAANQLWKVHYNGSGNYSVSCVGRDGWMMYAGQNMDGGSVQLEYTSSNPSNGARIMIVPTASGNFRITSKEICAYRAIRAGSGSTVEAYIYSGANNQQWVFEKFTLALNHTQLEMVSGQVDYLFPTVSLPDLTWTTSDIHTVMAAGDGQRCMLLARDPGTATITATAPNGDTATCTVTVPLVVQLSISQTSFDLAVGSTLDLRQYITISSNNGNTGLTCTSSNTSVATVSGGGVVTAHAVGTATITVKSSADPSKSVVCDIVVLPNIPFNDNYRNNLIDDFNRLLGLGRKTLLHLYTPQECIEIILYHDQDIVALCNTLGYEMPKAYIQALLMRELWCVNEADIVADMLVECGINDDSSTGYGQIFARTAIGALNYVNSIELPTEMESMDEENLQDVHTMWTGLHNDQLFNIKMVYYEILNCTFKTNQSNRLFWQYSEAQIKAILARYNGTGDDAVQYGNEVYEYYQIFNSYSLN